MNNCLAVLLCGCLFITSCQPLMLKGQVFDEEHSPIANVSILLKSEGGLSASFRTDSSGRFIIQKCRYTDTLLILAKGYYSETLPVSLCLKQEVFICLQKPAYAAGFRK